MKSVIACAGLLGCIALTAEQPTPVTSLPEQLGYPANSKLLIVHGDDFGEWHAVNTATIEALESGAITSASMMVPCPWVSEAAAYARANPDVDLGLHLTVTSERTHYRWAPVFSNAKLVSLVDNAGYFHRAPSEMAQLDVREVEHEIRAQIERAIALGVQPTHVDSHQGALYSTRAVFGAMAQVAGEFGIPVMVSRTKGHGAEWLDPDLPANAVVVNRISIRPEVAPHQWAAWYTDAIRGIQPGLTQLVVHLAHATDEIKAATADRSTWDAAWRQRDFDFVTSGGFKKLLAEQNVKLVTWREIGRVLDLEKARSTPRARDSR